jgi:hypothetical protein
MLLFALPSTCFREQSDSVGAAALLLPRGNISQEKNVKRSLQLEGSF